MKKIYSLLLLSLIATCSLAQTPFNASEKWGFHAPSLPYFPNGSVTDLKTFKGSLYVGMGNDSGYVFRSATGDPGSYQKVFDQYAIQKVGKMAVSNDGPGYLYMSTLSYFSVAMVKRTVNGTTWDDFFESPGGAAPSSVSVFKPFGGTVDSVYVAYNGVNGTTIVRNALDANDPNNAMSSWDTLTEMFTQFGTFASPTASFVFNDSLYYAFSDNSLFQTGDGRNLHVNTAFISAMGAGSGLGNSFCSAMEVFGGELYLGTENNNSGFELWKTADGINFVNISDSLYGGISTVAQMKSAGGKLWILAKGTAGDFKIYSYDGTVLTLENNNEFGAVDVDANYDSGMELFNNHLYVGITSYFMPARYAAPKDGIQASSSTTGGQVWRACMLGGFPAVDITNTNPTYICEGNNVNLNSTGDAVSYIWNTGATTTSINVVDSGEYALTGVGSNGCRYADFGTVSFYAPAQPPLFTSGINPAPVTGPIGICAGDSTPVITARDPINDFNAINIPGFNSGLQTTANPVFNGNLDITIELWFKPVYGGGVIVSEYDTLSASSWTNNNYSLIRYDFNNDVYIGLPGSTTAEIWLGNMGSTIDQWNHVVLRYANGTGTFDGFLNGIPGGSDVRLREIPESSGGYDAYKIGMEALTPFYVSNFNGQVRDIRIWNAVRTNTEITDNMYKLPAGSYPSLVYYYKTQETFGSVAYDSSGNNFNATLNGLGAFVTPQVINWTASPTAQLPGNSQAVMFPDSLTMYTASYTDLNGCSASGSIGVEPLYISIYDVYSSNFASCGGNPVFVEPSTNATLYNPTWTSTSIGSVSTYSTAVTPPVSEYLYLTDTVNSGSCILRDSVLIKAGPAFTSGLGNPLPVYACEGTQVMLNALPNGGTAPYMYIWISGLGKDTTYVDSILYSVASFYNEVSINATDAIGCSFSAIIPTSPYSSTDLFGHVSTPAPANVDAGYVYVFKHQPGNAGYDTVGYTGLNTNGDYLFSPLTAGNYLIKVLPDETAFPLAVPTYYGNAFQWDSSLVYTHGCSQNDTANIQVVESTANITGPGSISGYIIEGDGFGTNRLLGPGVQPNNPFAPGGPLKGVDVKLGKNPGGGIQARTMSDSTGFYVFDSLPVGGYKIYVDIPNLPMDSTREITIAGADSSIQNNYFADSASVYINPDTISSVGIYSSAKHYENNFVIYPNPAKGAMYISYELKESSSVGFEIVNTMGQLMKSEPIRKYPEGNNIFIFNTEQLNLQGGVYFISIITNNKKYTQRIVVID